MEENPYLPITLTVVLIALGIWWFRPLLQLLHPAEKAPEKKTLHELRERTLLQPQEQAAVDAARVSFGGRACTELDGSQSHSLNFEQIFAEQKSDAKACIEECVKEQSLKNLHCMAKVVDNVLHNLAEDKFQRLVADNEKLQKEVLRTAGGARLVELCGFTLRDGMYIWNTDKSDYAKNAECVFRTLVMRSAIAKMLTFARDHGTRRWTMGKMEVLPVEYELEPSDIFLLKDITILEDTSSQKERYLEHKVRQKLDEMRALRHLDAITAACRRFTALRRERYRQNEHGARGHTQEVTIDVLVKELVPALSPGIECAHFHWNGDLPHSFGMASATGSRNEKVDTAMDQIVAEAVGSWRTLHHADLHWIQASAMGVGAAIDYSANIGFLCAVYVGFPFGKAIER